jgi:iron uptake system component EfeO
MLRTTIVAAAAVLALAVSGCGSSSKTAADSAVKRVEIKLTDAGCDPARIEVAAGRTEFEITNDGADKVTEFEVLDGDKVLGEKENLTPGLSGDFTVTLKAGTFRTLCPNGKTAAEGKLIVTG